MKPSSRVDPQVYLALPFSFLLTSCLPLDEQPVSLPCTSSYCHGVLPMLMGLRDCGLTL